MVAMGHRLQAVFREGLAEDLDGAPVFMAPSAWDITYEAERWPEIAFADIKDYQKEHA